MALSILRRHAKSKLIKILLGAVALSFVIGFGAFTYVSRSNKGGGPDNNVWVAKVDGMPIDLMAIGQTMRFLEDRYRKMLGDTATQMLGQLDLPNLALREMINERVVEIVANRMGLVVSDTELADSIYRMGAFQINGRFDRQRYVNILRRHKMTPPEFEAEHRRELLAQKLRFLVRSTVKVADSELREEFLNREDKVNLKYVKLVPENVEGQIALTDDEVNAYFEANKEDFKMAEKRKVNYLTLTPAEFVDQVEVDDASISNYYNEHIDEFSSEEEVKARHILIKAEADADPVLKQAAKIKAEGILKQLNDGADFAALAAANSEDPGSKTRGGDLGWFGRGRMVPPFEEAAFSLEVGQTSGLVESEYGFHIIQVTDKHGAGTKSLDQVRDQIEGQLALGMARDMAEKKAQELYELINPEEDLLTFGSDRGLKVGSSSTFIANMPIPGIINGRQASRIAFQMQNREISEPFVTANAIYLIQLTNIIEEHLPTLAEVEAEVRDKMRQQRQQEQLKVKAAEMIAQLQAGKSIDTIAAMHSLDVAETGLFARSAGSVPKLGRSPELLGAAFDLTTQNPVAPEAYASGNGVVIITLTERQKPSDEEFAAKKEEIKEELISQKAQLTLQAWIEQAQKSIKVERNEEVLQALSAQYRARNNQS